MIKGKSHHVMPYEAGWCVVDESNPMVIRHFEDRESALAYAQDCARRCEGEVLVHTTCSQPSELSTVPLPQQEVLPRKAHVGMSSIYAEIFDLEIRNSMPDRPEPTPEPKQKSDFDPLLGYDEYYFEI